MKNLLRGLSLCLLLGLQFCAGGLFTTVCRAQSGTIPTASGVGASCLPASIAPVRAPFATVAASRPVFPSLRVSVSRAAAGAGLATDAIQAAIDSVHVAGGGTVVVGAGVWHTGRLVLRSHVNLHVAAGAELHFSGRVADYQPAVFTRNEGVELFSLGAMIYAYQAHNIAVTGQGKLIGPPLDAELRRRVTTLSVDKIDASTPVARRVYNGTGNAGVFLPTFIGPVRCTDVFIEGVTLERSAFWNVVPVYCDGVIIRGITVRSVGIPRGDGIDIDSSRNVLIEYCTLSCGDDCFTIKAGRGEDALRVGIATENVVIRHCLALEGHGGVTCGSETGSGIRNVYAHDCVFVDVVHGIRFKTRRPRGGGGSNLHYERIRMENTSKAIYWDMLGSSIYVGGMASRMPLREVTALTPAYTDISIKDIVVQKTNKFVELTGIPESPVKNVSIEGATVLSSQALMSLHDVDGFLLKNATLHSKAARVDVLDGRGIVWQGVVFDVPGGKAKVELKGTLSEDIRQ